MVPADAEEEGLLFIFLISDVPPMTPVIITATIKTAAITAVGEVFAADAEIGVKKGANVFVGGICRNFGPKQV